MSFCARSASRREALIFKKMLYLYEGDSDFFFFFKNILFNFVRLIAMRFHISLKHDDSILKSVVLLRFPRDLPLYLFIFCTSNLMYFVKSDPIYSVMYYKIDSVSFDVNV